MDTWCVGAVRFKSVSGGCGERGFAASVGFMVGEGLVWHKEPASPVGFIVGEGLYWQGAVKGPVGFIICQGWEWQRGVKGPRDS